MTRGGRGTKAIAARLRYISKNGRLEIEDQGGETIQGKDSLRDLVDEWRYGGSLIPGEAGPGHRREAYDIMLSMPHGTDPLSVQRAAREFAQAELADHESEVLMQFLIEAIVLSTLGGLAGLAIGPVASFGLTSLMHIPHAFGVSIDALALISSVVIGVAFRYIPARRAARRVPIEALRHELDSARLGGFRTARDHGLIYVSGNTCN